jgi:hypothetical protein
MLFFKMNYDLKKLKTELADNPVSSASHKSQTSLARSIRMIRVVWFPLVLMFLLMVTSCMSGVGIPAVCAASRYAGVAPNQFLRYQWDSETLSGNDTELMAHMAIYHGWINIMVDAVSGNMITYEFTSYNGTIATNNATASINVEAGQDNPGNADFLFFIAANLSVNDPIYTGNAYSSRRITETILTDYLDSQRETNHLSYQYNATNASGPGGIVANTTGQVDYYWDKTSGINVQFTDDINTSRSDNGGGVLVTHWRTEIPIRYAVPPVPELSSQLILPIFMIVALVAVIASKSMKRKPARLRRSLPLQGK